MVSQLSGLRQAPAMHTATRGVSIALQRGDEGGCDCEQNGFGILRILILILILMFIEEARSYRTQLRNHNGAGRKQLCSVPHSSTRLQNAGGIIVNRGAPHAGMHRWKPPQAGTPYVGGSPLREIDIKTSPRFTMNPQFTFPKNLLPSRHQAIPRESL